MSYEGIQRFKLLLVSLLEFLRFSHDAHMDIQGLASLRLERIL